MALSPVQLQGIDEVLSQQLGTSTKLYKIAAPFTTIINRALVTDLTNDHAPKFGVNRIMTQFIQEAQGELGPSGQRVFKPINDNFDQIRFIGEFANSDDSSGLHIDAGTTACYTEITFWGTGLNGLYYIDSGARTVGVSIDGGSVTNVAVTGQNSLVNNSKYSPNYVINLASGLTPGIHTAKLTHTGANLHLTYGFEIITATATLQYPTGASYVGGRKLTNASAKTDPYASVFESGTLGTTGGHVVVYQKPDGTIKKAVTPAAASPSYFTGTVSHTNEDVIRSYYWREFGVGNATDFQTMPPSSLNTRAFTLDDDITTLYANNIAAFAGTTSGVELLGSSVTGRNLTFTFVGTGLDIFTDYNVTPASMIITIDGVSIGTTSVISTAQVYKLVSGLPYGTHTVKIDSSNVGTFGISKFITYGPKKPTVPTGSIELADYYVMANYSGASSALTGFVSTGVLRKLSLREFTYGATWGLTGINTSFQGGWDLRTTTAASYVEFTFFGTGVEYYTVFNAVAYNLTVTIDGSSNLSGFTTVLVASSGLSFTAATGVISGTPAVGGNNGSLQISGLSLGIHKIRVTTNNTAFVYADAFDVITPVHAPKSDIPGDLQSTLSIGSCSLGDSRKFPAQTVKALANWAQAVGVASSPTTSSTSFVPMPDMVCTIKTSGNPIEISFFAALQHTVSGSNMNTIVYVDGIQISQSQSLSAAPGSGVNAIASSSIILPVAAGTHTVQVYWSSNTATLSAFQLQRVLKVREIT